MMTNESKIVYPELSYQIVGLAMDVHNRLGNGFLEKVYENAMMVLLRRAGIRAQHTSGSSTKIHSCSFVFIRSFFQEK